MPQWHKGSCAGRVKNERIHVFSFLTIKNKVMNENVGHYLNIQDVGQMVKMLCSTMQIETPGHPIVGMACPPFSKCQNQLFD